MGRRTLLLVVSMLIAAVGVALIGLYVRGADDRATTRAEAKFGPQPTATSTPKPTSTNIHTDLNGYGLTIDVANDNRAIGLLVPGDLVSIYLSDKDKPDPVPVVSSIKVVSVGVRKTVIGANSEQVPATILGLDASLKQAKAIEGAKTRGDLLVFVIGSKVEASANAAATAEAS